MGANSCERMRCLGIDYGEKRTGLSYGDELGVALPLPALVGAEPEARWRKLTDTIRERRVTDLVLGYPYNMDGTAGFKAKEVEAFAAKLGRLTRKPGDIAARSRQARNQPASDGVTR